MSTDERFRAVRKEYERDSLHEGSVEANPLVQFRAWLEEALKAPEVEPNACALATVGPDGKPSLRMVLMHTSPPGRVTRSLGRLCLPRVRLQTHGSI